MNKLEAYYIASKIIWNNCDGIEDDERPHPWEEAAEWFDKEIEKMTSSSTSFGIKTFEAVPLETAGAEYKAVDPLAAAPLIRAFPDAQISKNFRLSEFRPGRHTYEYIRISPTLIRVLEEIRAQAGRPVIVTSGYRPPDYNREVGGVSNSTHIDGLAADIYCEGLTTDQLYDICDQVIGQQGGVGHYPQSGIVHVDVRGYRARWCDQWCDQ